MPVRAFVDSNVLLYLISSDRFKADRAEQLSASGGVISIQVLNEFANFARRKHGASWERVHGSLVQLRNVFEVRPITLDIHLAGLKLAEDLGYSIYDSLLLAAALLADCDIFWSEDLQHGQVIKGRLTIRNPFL
jgi:predicted nucleic acid-binding protein